MNKPGIEEAVVLLMQHALQVNPAQPSWLRTQADIYFGKTRIVSVSVYGRKMCDYEQIGGGIDTDDAYKLDKTCRNQSICVDFF